jgi:hypothetical protein
MRLVVMIASVALLAVSPARAQLAGALGPAGSPGGGSPLIQLGELQVHVDHLTSDALAGRRAGTPGAERAARYVVRAFEQAGLQAPDAWPSYLQPFDFTVGVEPGPENRLALQRGSRPVSVFASGRDFLPLSGSLADRVVQSVVFVGYGISAPGIGYDDYRGVDVRGKIVIAFRYSPEGDDPTGRFSGYLEERDKAATARAKGARAILFVNPPATEAIDRLIPFSPDANPRELGIVALSITQEAARRIVSAGDGDLVAWQRAIDRTGSPASRALPHAIVNLRTDIRVRTRTTHNVIGVAPGRDPLRAREVVVIGAHYDGLGLGGKGSLDPVPGEIHNGADDNASGVSALLELAQFFAYPTNRPERTLVFVAFGAEEEGMLGSARFVTDPPVPLASVVGMINMDMIGRLEDEVIVYGVGSSSIWTEELEAANGDPPLRLRLMAEGYGPSDHAAFYLRQIPVLAFFTGVHGDYHRSTDDAARIDLDGLHQITRLIRNVVAQIASGRERPAFDPREYSPREVIAVETPDRPSVRIGAVPGPAGPEGGLLVDAVVDASPAAAAGLQAGDRIVHLGGKPIDSVYDYMQVLAELEPDQPVSLIIERRGTRVELTVIPQ